MLIKEADRILSHFQFDNNYLHKSLNKQTNNINTYIPAFEVTELVAEINSENNESKQSEEVDEIVIGEEGDTMIIQINQLSK